MIALWMGHECQFPSAGLLLQVHRCALWWLGVLDVEDRPYTITCWQRGALAVVSLSPMQITSIDVVGGPGMELAEVIITPTTGSWTAGHFEV